MKKYCLLLSVALLSGCSDLLEEEPRDQLAQETFFRTADDARAAVFGIYSPLRSADTYGSWYPAIMANLDDYTLGRGSQVAISEYQGFDGTNIARAERIWRDLYQSINFANIALQGIPDIPMDEAEKAALLAEARFMRAFNYFTLVRNYGAVPIRQEPVVTDDQIGAPRRPVSDVYAFIEADLYVAEQALPDEPAQPGRPTKWAAKTMLADVYLTTEQWEKARDKAEEVIASDKFALVPVSSSDDFEQIYGPTEVTNSEEIFAFKFTRVAGLGWSFVIFPYASDTPYSPGGYRAFFAKPTFPLIANWDDADLRKDFNLYTTYVSTSSGQATSLPENESIGFRKYRDGQAPSTSAYGNDYYFYRYPDALLIYAEAASMANNGPTAEAVERLNMVKRRAYGFAPTAPSAVDVALAGQTATSFRTAVLTERAYEFMLESKRWLDLKRAGIVKETIREALGKEVADAHLLWPIPRSEIDNNPDIGPEDQNPGY
ncbi:Starch-binding associating with outer membrane [Catalinimonas alkaloidigena]|uniref:Starch-binding associating with outer membrane n=1 Tax=Catalinimonas alkaloidigena TaxID=1075417 RepID=A0A1G9REZ7_9BACT|nr:RagB/SusD family nutrient uptake outer membrane protein [Catalinimonas alkaloidigena]SDM21872.1 Starch-binding associating with outer membrane [Catalinimonas alkaloidigena]